MSAAAVSVSGHRLLVGDRRIPLISGEVQFWRMAPETWAPALRAAAGEDIPIVATYLSWRRHAPAPDVLDLDGHTDPRLNVRRFLDLCADHGLLVHLKPGPWICAEEPGGGYPDWLLADESLLARDAAGEIVIGYNPPFRHPVPSYLAPGYLAYAAAWLSAVDTALAGYLWPRGPVVLIQLDNEPSYCFRDGFYDSDYHPAVLAAFRGRHGWSDAPRPGSEPNPRQERDWTVFKEWLTAEHLRRLAGIHTAAGAGGVLFTVNMNRHPVPDVPQAAAALATLDRTLVGDDHYYEPPLGADAIVTLARSAATARAAGHAPVWAAELQAGIWRSPGERIDYPDPEPGEQGLLWTAALAVGFTGANLYMLANRENWELAPLHPDGTPAPMITPLRALRAALAEIPHWDGYQPCQPVALFTHRPYTRDAYRAHGRSDRWPDAGPFTAWQRTLAALVLAGHQIELWDSTEPAAPPQCVAAVVPYPELPGPLAERVLGCALPVLRGESALAPPVRTDRPDTLALLRHRAGDRLCFVLNWGGKRTRIGLRFATPEGGRLLPLDVQGSGAGSPITAGRATITLPARHARIYRISKKGPR